MSKVLLTVCVAIIAFVGVSADVSASICSDSSAIVQNAKISLSPADAKPGMNLTITLAGDVTAPVDHIVDEYSTIYNGFPVRKGKVDLCTGVNKDGCHWSKGPFSHTSMFPFPHIPAGAKLSVKNMLMDQAGKEVMCYVMNF